MMTVRRRRLRPRILKCLQDNGGRATFFMVGKQVIKSPDVLKQMVAQGCEVANHTYDHTLMTKVAPVELANQLVADKPGGFRCLRHLSGADASLRRRKDRGRHEHCRRDFHAGDSLEC